MTRPRFHGLLVVRDEADIIAQSVTHALEWIDTIWVLDTGSTDATFDILRDLAAGDARLHLLGRHEVIFDQSLRAFLFEAGRAHFSEGDWIVKLDADEFYHVAPPDFVAWHVQPHEGLVDLRWYYFRLTEEEAAAYPSDSAILADRARPIGERRRYFKMPGHREPRMFRYRRSMRFAASNNAPFYAGIRCPVPIPVRHYPHRDPMQMRARFALRSQMKDLGSRESAHWDLQDWQAELVSAQTGEALGASGLSAEAGHDGDRLFYWDGWSDLPSMDDQASEQISAPRRLTAAARRLFYAGPVRLADRLKPGFDEPDLLERRAVVRLGQDRDGRGERRDV